MRPRPVEGKGHLEMTMAPSRIRRCHCNRLFRVPANLNQSITNPADGVKNVKHLFAGSKNHRCTRPGTSICGSSSSHPQTSMDWNGGRSGAGSNATTRNHAGRRCHHGRARNRLGVWRLPLHVCLVGAKRQCAADRGEYRQAARSSPDLIALPQAPCYRGVIILLPT